jgi:hypothetical protein
LNTAEAGDRGMRDVAPSWTNSIKPGMQFSCNLVVIHASEKASFFLIFKTYLFMTVGLVYKTLLYIITKTLHKQMSLLTTSLLTNNYNLKLFYNPYLH